MVYTVTKLARLSGVSVRTLHYYDEIGLLKPAYHGAQGYRYYEEKQLLLLQQILFFRELGIELKEIQKILKRDDFNQIIALTSHREALKKNLEKTRTLIKTIDKTIDHLKGKQKMKENEFYSGFDREKQAAYEQQLIERFGDQAKEAIGESQQKIKNWKKGDWEASGQEFAAICQELSGLLEKGLSADAKEVQEVIGRHYQWLKRFWTPNRESYTGHGQFIVESELRQAYEAYHKKLPEFICEGIAIFARTL